MTDFNRSEYQTNLGDEDEEAHATKFDTSGFIRERGETSSLANAQFKRTPAHIPVLMVLEGENIGERYALTKTENMIGRREGSDICLHDRKMSRSHCRITITSTGEHVSDFKVVLTDEGSTNGTYVNGKRIRGPVELTDGDKILVGSTLLGFFIKFAEEVELENRLLRLATRDALTGLYNRAFFNPTINFEFKRSKRYNRDLSLILFDLDHFKKVNDTYGHIVGDSVLKEVGRILLETLRSHDIPVRYGGEEFAIALIESTLDQAVACAERLRQLIERHEFSSGDSVFHITASFGVAFCHEGVRTPEDLIKEADRALYYAKYAGRNNVKVSGEIINDATDTANRG
ncbi:MAG: GGDEF domain-containing protein [Candidatus Sumerlaeia bacterium]